MSPVVGIIVLCTIPGISASILQASLLKRCGKAGSLYRIVACYIGLFYGVLSLVKMIVDSGNLTLTESFTDIVSSTYLHYLIPLMLMAIIIPCLIYFIFRNADISGLMSLFDSVMFVILAFGFIIMNRISNTYFVTALIISVLSALWGIFIYKGDIAYFSHDDLKQRLKYAAPPSLLYVVTVILSIPGTLFLNNQSEITIVPSSFAKALLIGAVVYFVLIVGLGVLLLTWRQLELFYTVVFAITIAGYIQSMLLNGRMTAMDGGKQTWQGAQLWINTLIWIILVAGIFLLKSLIHKDVTKLYRAISIYLCLIQIVSLGFLAVTAYIKNDNTDDADWILSTDWALELHPDNNVLVFVLDWYDEQILEKILAEDNDFLSPLDGFTYYPNATSLYAFTEMSLPYLLSGVEWQYDMEKHEYIEYAYSSGHMLDDICDAGYSIGLYTRLNYISNTITNKLCNYTQYYQYCPVQDTVNLMAKCSKYQMAPFGLKSKYWYTTDQIIDLATDDGFTRWVTSEDLPFYTALTKTGITIDKSSTGAGSFKFYHMCGAHMPYLMTENITRADEDTTNYASMLSQAKGSMKIVFEYIEQLKALDMYDSTTIIITADHGENFLYDRISALENLELNKTSSPILLVKKAHQTWEGVRQNAAPVSHTEVVASIVATINPQTTVNYGSTLEDIEESANRERIFIFTRDDLPYVKAIINGDALDEESWTVVETVPLD